MIRKDLRRFCQLLLQISLTRPKNDQLRPRIDDFRQNFENQVDPFLDREPADNPQQRSLCIDGKTEPFLKSRFVDGLLCEAPGIVGLFNHCIGARVPSVGVDSVQDAAKLQCPRGENSFESETEFLGHDFPRMGRADRRQSIRVADTRLQE